MTLRLNCVVHMGIVCPTLYDNYMDYTLLHYDISLDIRPQKTLLKQNFGSCTLTCLI